ncbi:unnamed protein product [Discosporangium mesarthrocarpum]
MGFEPGEVARIATASALEFLERHNCAPDLRVFLVDRPNSAGMTALLDHVPRATEAAGEKRLILEAGELSMMAGRFICVVNPCNWRLAGHGGRTNTQVNKAAGPCLEARSRERCKFPTTAVPVPIKLPQDSPLHAAGVEIIIQVLGPNLNPLLPECLDKDPREAVRLLRLSYDRALDCFWRQVAGDDSTIGAEKSNGSAGRGGADLGTGDVFPPYNTALGKTMRLEASGGLGSWRDALHQYTALEARPNSLQDRVFFETNSCVIIYDGYPKARRHLLLVLKKQVMDLKGPSDLRREHLPILREQHTLAMSVAESLQAEAGVPMRCGYHALPSLEPLHLHIISEDLESPFLKKKAHWNSFSTDFFLKSSWVEEKLEQEGQLDLDQNRYQSLKEQPLQCHRCGATPANIPLLKEHNRACFWQAMTEMGDLSS